MKRFILLIGALLLAGSASAQPAAVFPSAFPQYFDANGNPLDSGTISFFQAGTTTPLTVYSDSTLSTPIGTSLTLDATGRPPTQVFVPASAFKAVLKDSGGSTIRTSDNLAGAVYLAQQAVLPVVQTTTSTGTVNDFALSSQTATLVILRCNNAGDLTLTGFGAPTIVSQRLIVVSAGAGNVFFSHLTGSSAANQLVNFITSTTTPLAAGKGVSEFEYDATTSRWRLLSHVQGAALSWTPALSFGGGTTGLTYTSRTGSYIVAGRTATYELEIQLSAKGSSSGAAVIAGLPFTTTNPTSSILDAVAGMTGFTGVAFGAVGATSINLVQTSSTNRGTVTEANFSNTSFIRLSLQAIVQ